jgi:hypothetical protein
MGTDGQAWSSIGTSTALEKSGDAMALKNLEEAIVDRIQRALTKELKRLRRKSLTSGNGHATNDVLVGQQEISATQGSHPFDR